MTPFTWAVLALGVAIVALDVRRIFKPRRRYLHLALATAVGMLGLVNVTVYFLLEDRLSWWALFLAAMGLCFLIESSVRFRRHWRTRRLLQRARLS